MSIWLTARQRWYLNLASAKPMTTRDLVEGRRLVEFNETIDAGYHTLARMRGRGLLRLSDGRWHITDLGREALRSTA